MTNPDTLYSVVVPVGSRFDDVSALVEEYAAALRSAAVNFEIIAVFDGRNDALLQTLQQSDNATVRLRIVQFSRQFGESAALMAGFDEARGDIIITLPAYWQVAASEIPKLIDAVGDQDDMLIAVRWPRASATFDRIRRGVFHGLLRFVTSFKYRDLGCGVRLFRRQVANEISLYGDQYRFLPLLAVRRGFNVREVELAQSTKDRYRGRYSWREYIHRILDLMTVFFLVRFTKKPLRFFGSLGFIAGGFGAIVVAILVAQRLVYGSPLADRPALLLASLLVVLGVQLFGLGLLGELVIFSHAADTKEYAIRSIAGGRHTGNRTADTMADEKSSENAISETAGP